MIAKLEIWSFHWSNCNYFHGTMCA